jgi:hypothetical protein
MALIATCVRELVVAVHMTRLARCRCMRAGQRELRRTVIECRGLPDRRRVARLANMTESG